MTTIHGPSPSASPRPGPAQTGGHRDSKCRTGSCVTLRRWHHPIRVTQAGAQPRPRRICLPASRLSVVATHIADGEGDVSGQRDDEYDDGRWDGPPDPGSDHGEPDYDPGADHSGEHSPGAALGEPSCNALHDRDHPTVLACWPALGRASRRSHLTVRRTQSSISPGGRTELTEPVTSIAVNRP